MKPNPGKSHFVPHEYSSAVEREIGESLERTLATPWSVEIPTHSVDVPTGSGQMNYTPDFLITNSATGHTLAVEVKSSLSLSMPNIIKFQHIQAALGKQGTDFLVVVHGGAPDEAGPTVRLGEYGINAVGVSGAVDAAGEIEKQLAS